MKRVSADESTSITAKYAKRSSNNLCDLCGEISKNLSEKLEPQRHRLLIKRLSF